VPKLLVKLALVGYFGLFLLLTAALAFYWERWQKPPEQPIAFPHTIHAGQLELACTFCHENAARSPRAGAPSIRKCMSCHQTVAVDNPEVKKLRRYHQEEEPIAWVRLHTLPDHVYFTHKRHIKFGLDCSDCHGEVRKMEKMQRVRSLEMGWCVTCHRSLGAPTDCATCHK